MKIKTNLKIKKSEKGEGMLIFDLFIITLKFCIIFYLI